MQLCVEGNLRYFANILKQRKNCEICADSSKVTSIRSWDARNSSFMAAILFFQISEILQIIQMIGIDFDDDFGTDFGTGCGLVLDV
jgi:hypothetical protein